MRLLWALSPPCYIRPRPCAAGIPLCPASLYFKQECNAHPGSAGHACVVGKGAESGFITRCQGWQWVQEGLASQGGDAKGWEMMGLTWGSCLRWGMRLAQAQPL